MIAKMKTLKICHFSDWHTHFMQLPWADIYVCTGDMLPNFPLCSMSIDDERTKQAAMWDINKHLIVGGDKELKPPGYVTGRTIDHLREADFQQKWLEKHGSFRMYMANQEATVLCVRGNHDFTSLKPLFGEPVFEIEDPTQIIYVKGIKFGGMRGMKKLIGEWSDEIDDYEAEYRARKLPLTLDVLVTHSPPLGTLDFCGENIGLHALASYINRCIYSAGDTDNLQSLQLHLFGHCHEAFGYAEHEGISFSNAATRYRVIELQVIDDT